MRESCKEKVEKGVDGVAKEAPVVANEDCWLLVALELPNAEDVVPNPNGWEVVAAKDFAALVPA